jgi:hypothetical protein
VLRNKLYKMKMIRYSVASARLYSDRLEGETSGGGATLAACIGRIE